MDDHDELTAALARYARATPFGDKHRPVECGPVDTFPRLRRRPGHGTRRSGSA